MFYDKQRQQQQNTNKNVRKLENILATQILQVFYVDLESNFTKPIAFFCHNGLSGEKLRIIFDEGLELFNKVYSENSNLPELKVLFCSFDGESSNRSFVNTFTKKEWYGKQQKYCEKIWKAYNEYTKTNMYFISDPEHLIKKLRNNLHDSCNTTPFHMKYENFLITWDFIVNAYKRETLRPIKTTGLTQAAVELSTKSKMRTCYANQIFSRRLIREIEDNEPNSKGILWYLITGVNLKQVMYSKEKIKTTKDHQLDVLLNIDDEWSVWEMQTEDTYLPSSETRYDLKLYCRGVVSLVKYCLKKFDLHICINRLNSNYCENWFSMQRLCSSNNTNPTCLEYQQHNSILESIIELKESYKSTSYSKSDFKIPNVELKKIKNPKPLMKISISEMIEAKNIINAHMKNFVWAEDKSMTIAVVHACGYILKSLKNCFSDDISSKMLLDIQEKNTSIFVTPKQEVVDFFTFLLKEMHKILLKYEIILAMKKQFIIVCYNYLRESSSILQKWNNLLINLGWNTTDKKRYSSEIFEKSLFLWCKIWVSDFLKKHRLNPVRGKKSFRNSVSDAVTDHVQSD